MRTSHSGDSIAPVSAVFDISGKVGNSPVVISVPHAGRDYPPALAAQLAVPLAKVRALEDRHVDVLTGLAAGRGHAVLVARAPRLLIDLNRAETDYDAATIRGAHPGASRPSFRARGGLGLVPDRLAGVGRLWRAPVDIATMTARIAAIHRPYHAALARLITAARARHGIAVLIDLHSMPPLKGLNAADVVIGDLHGRCADRDIIALLAELLAERGLRTALNTPYAGGHLIERHARPDAGVHTVQLEIDRRLYLDTRLDTPGSQAARIARIIADLADALASGAQSALPVAAE